MNKAVFALAAAMLVGCDRPDGGARRFVVGFDADFPPYGFVEDGECRGFDLDLAREVCAKRGWTFVAAPIVWDCKDEELNSGSIDCIWSGFTMQGREGAYTFSSPYMDNSQVVLVKAGSSVATLADLAGKVVGVQVGTPVQKALSKGGDKEALGSAFKALVEVSDYGQAVLELAAGNFDAVALDIGVAKRKMADSPGSFRMLDDIVSDETYAIGFRKGNVALRDEVESALREIAAEGTMSRLAVKYGIEPGSLLVR